MNNAFRFQPFLDFANANAGVIGLHQAADEYQKTYGVYDPAQCEYLLGLMVNGGEFRRIGRRRKWEIQLQKEI